MKPQAEHNMEIGLSISRREASIPHLETFRLQGVHMELLGSFWDHFGHHVLVIPLFCSVKLLGFPGVLVLCFLLLVGTDNVFYVVGWAGCLDEFGKPLLVQNKTFLLVNIFCCRG